jgi:tight adherence protein B
MNGLQDLGLGALVYVGVFLGALMVFDGVWQLISRRERTTDARNRRMRLIAKGATPSQVLSLLRPDRAEWSLKSVPVIGTLQRDLQQAGMTIRPSTVLIFGLFAFVVVGVALSTRISPPLAFGAAAIVGLFGPVVIVRSRRDERMKLLVSQLPDALELMARGLKVGHPLNTTIASVARDMIDPVASEFGIVVDQISYGDDLVNAFRDLADRTGLEDVSYLATSVAIQNGTGGDLARVLMTLGRVIRGRIAMRQRIKAISAEGRATAAFMSFLPVFIFGSTSLLSPDYYRGVSDDPMFRPIAIIIVSLMVANFFAMRKLVNFKI